MKTTVPIVSFLLITTFAFSGCDTPGESAGLGAAAGGALAAATGHGPYGVLRGAAIGAGTGYLVGKVVQHDREDRYYDDQDRNDGPDDRDRGDDRNDDRDRGYDRDHRRDYPVARPTRHEGYVISPYYPHNRIDVRGVPSGAQVMDPSVNRIFINP